MRFTPHFLDEIRARLPVSQVVGQRVKLRKQGREFAGLSPFNKEKTPSFFVNDQKGFYHCFSSGKHGSIFDFLMETEGVTFPEAVERLAAMAGLEVPKERPQDVERERRRASLHDVMDMAASFFEAGLAGRAGSNARAYLDRREIRTDTRARFRIGYAGGDRTALKRHLAGEGVPVEDMIDCGLLVHGEDIADPFDRFRDRIMFPIQDLRGRVVAFGGRAMQADAPAKYLNSPETVLFHKGALLFNHHRARTAAHDAGTVVAVEGYMDVIALDQAGIGHAVAPLGTALTPDQIELLWRMTPEPILCFDGDKAGTRAAHRAVDIALPAIKPGRSIRFAFLPDGQDPDDLVRNSGRLAMEDVLSRAAPLVEVLWTRELDARPIDTPERAAALERRLADLVATIGDESVKRHYQSAIGERLRAFAPQPEPAGFRGRQRRNGGGGDFQRRSQRPGSPREPLRITSSLRQSPGFAPGRISAREAAILIALLRHPRLLDRHAETLAEMPFSSPELDRLRGCALDAAAHGEADTPDQMIAHIARCGLAEQLARAEASLMPGLWWTHVEADDLDAETGFLHSLALHLKTYALNRDLKAAEAALGEDTNEENFSRLLDIQQQLRTVQGTEASIEGFGAASGRPVRSL